MFKARISRLMAGVVCFVAVAFAAFAQQTLWEKYSKAGVKAHGEGRFLDAEKLFEDALNEAQASGAEDARLATSLMNLAQVKKGLGKFNEVEFLYLRALAIREKVLGADHLEVASSLNELGMLYYQMTQPQYVGRQKLIIIENLIPWNMRPDLIAIEPSQRQTILLLEKYLQAEALLQRALTIRENLLPPEHSDVALSAHNLGELFRAAGKYAEAEPLLRRALGIRERIYGPNDIRVTNSQLSLAETYLSQRKFEEAEPLYQRALAIREKSLGQEHIKVAEACEAYAALLRETKRATEAGKMEARAKRILSRQKKPIQPGQ